MRVTLFSFCLLSSLAAFADEEFTFPDRSGHCVAWKTKKRMFLVSTVRPVGINCDISSRFMETPQGKAIEIRIPINKFSSGEPDRDKEVVKILKSDVHPELIVQTDPSLSNPFESKGGELKAKLTIGGKGFPITVPYRVENRDVPLLVGSVKSTFTRFEIEPPTVGGGAIAKVHDELELHYQIRKDRVQ